MWPFTKARAVDTAMPRDGDVQPLLVTPADVGVGGRYAPSEAAELVLRTGCVWVQVAVSRNSAAVADTPLRLYRRVKGNGGMETAPLKVRARKALLESPSLSRHGRKAMECDYELEAVTDPAHPVIALLEQGWPGGSGRDLLTMWEGFRSLTGNGYVLLTVGPSGFPSQIWPMPSQYVRAVPNRQLLIDGYVIGRNTSIEQPWPKEMCLHLKSPNWGGDPYYGQGDLAAVMRDADAVKALTQFTLAAMDNMVLPSVWLWQQGMSQENRRDVENKLRARGGVRNAMKALVMGGTTKPELIQSQWPFGQGFTFVQDDSKLRDRIANAFDTPISLLTQDTAALAQAKVAVTQWRTLAIAPRCRRIEERLNESLIPLFADLDPTLVLCFDNPVQSDPDEIAKRAQVACGGPFKTVNEVRAEMQLPPVEGGDVLRMDPSAPPPDPFGGFGGPPADPKEGGEADKGLPFRGGKRKRMSDAYWHPKGCACCDHAPRSKRLGAKAADDVTMTVGQLEKALARYFAGLSTIIDPKIAQGVALITADDLAGTRAELRAAVEPVLAEAVGGGYTRGLGQLGGDTGDAQPWDSTLDRSARIVRTYSDRLASSVTRTTAERVTETLEAGMRAGKTTTEMQGEVGTLLGGDNQRAYLIAKTETQRAHSAGQVEAWQASGMVEGKEWLLSGNPCPMCLSASTEFKNVPLDEPMVPLGATLPGSESVNDYTPIDGPPMHPGCLCEMVPVMRKG